LEQVFKCFKWVSNGQYMRSQDFRMLMAMAGGIGASVGNTGSINFDRVDSSDFSAGKLKMGDRNH
jgi:hypothetical protein